MKIGTVTESQHEEDMQETLKKLELLLITDVSHGHWCLLFMWLFLYSI